MKKQKKDFELFKSECKKWIDVFELNDWRVDFIHSKVDDGDSVAQVQRHLRDKVVDVTFSTEKNYSDEFIKETAKHEMIHLLLGRFAELAWSRFLNVSELTSAEEELVRKIEYIIK